MEWYMDNKTEDSMASEPTAQTYGMSETLIESGILNKVRDLSHEDKSLLVRYIYGSEAAGVEDFADFANEGLPYTMDELNARIDEAEAGIERGEGKSFGEMMDGFRKELLWLK